MKYISLIVVIVFIALTFWFSKETEDLSIDQMSRMNRMITDYMTRVLEEKHPEAVEVEFSKIYNEVIENGRKMKAHFKFSYKEPNEQGELEKVYRKGSFLITSEDGRKWTAKIEEAGDVKVEFMEPFDINSNGKGNDSQSTDKIKEENQEDNGKENQEENSKDSGTNDLSNENGESDSSESKDNEKTQDKNSQ